MFEVDGQLTAEWFEHHLRVSEVLISQIRVRQAELLRRAAEAQVHTQVGAGSIEEWARERLDVTESTARDMMSLAKALVEEPHIEGMARAQESFDRIVATIGLLAAGADERTVERARNHDLAGVARLRNRHRRITRDEETAAFREQYLVLQETLDGSRTRVNGELAGVAGPIVGQALAERADSFNRLPGPRTSRAHRMADALVSIAEDSLDPDPAGGESAPASSRLRPLVTVFVDADLAGSTQGEAGAEVAYGPRVGPNTLEAMLCDGPVRVVGLADGTPVTTSAAAEKIPPAVRAYVMWRDGKCTVGGCTSRYRLQVHHIRHRTDGGDHDPGNLATLCWFHHHVVIHGMGFEIDPGSPPQRRRFIRRLHAVPGHDPP